MQAETRTTSETEIRFTKSELIDLLLGAGYNVPLGSALYLGLGEADVLLDPAIRLMIRAVKIETLDRLKPGCGGDNLSEQTG